MGKSILALGILGLSFVARGADELPARTMGVTQGPETVFEQAPGDFIPELGGARPTGENGRVGYELVFWGYDVE